MQFQLPSVRVDNSVWIWLAKEKLENLRLSTEPIIDKVFARVEQFAGSQSLVIRHDPSSPSPSHFPVTIYNVNTAREFREFDRAGMLSRYKNEWFSESSSLSSNCTCRIFLVSFADLKSYTFTYNVAVPTFGFSDFPFVAGDEPRAVSASDPMWEKVITESSEGVSKVEGVFPGPLILVKDLSWDSPVLPFYVRNVLAADCIGKDVGAISLLFIQKDVCATLYSRVEFPQIGFHDLRLSSSWVKWPSGVSSFTTIQTVDLRRFLDPSVIASDAVQLNIKLIKWRLLPSLDPARMTSLKCLLIGAGTLGCAVGRCLQSWGVGHITFVDSGNVAYSNPTRQWLYRLSDAAEGLGKAETAAARLNEVVPLVHCKGVCLSVPLPGHPSDMTNLEKTYSELRSLISQHDVVFMLTDSRESRWLPSLLVADSVSFGEQKLGISVALGFDSYLVKCITKKSACYFCNDVNAPTDSTSFRTLDQQCTVTRPGAAAIASCMAVELLASIVQTDVTGWLAEGGSIDGGLLGAVPDQIRGFLGSFQTFPAMTEKFTNCICCSEGVLRAFREDGLEFVKNAIENADILTKVSGLDEYTKRAEEAARLMEAQPIDDEEDDGW